MQSQSAYASYRLTSHASMINGHDYLPIPNYNKNNPIQTDRVISLSKLPNYHTFFRIKPHTVAFLNVKCLVEFFLAL